MMSVSPVQVKKNARPENDWPHHILYFPFFRHLRQGSPCWVSERSLGPGPLRCTRHFESESCCIRPGVAQGRGSQHYKPDRCPIQATTGRSKHLDKRRSVTPVVWDDATPAALCASKCSDAAFFHSASDTMKIHCQWSMDRGGT